MTTEPDTTTNLPERAKAWWQALVVGERRDAASIARLRRCRSNLEALMVPAALLLARRLGVVRDGRRLDAALGLARVLANVKSQAPASIMRSAGWKVFHGGSSDLDAGPGVRPLLSEYRFRRLMLTVPGEDLVVAFTRLVRLLDGKADVLDLSRAFLCWGSEQVRRRWAFDYYAAGEAAPALTATSEGDA